jgi:peptidoglycan/LPS O-acetylase OafA/YrhL
MSRLGVPNPVVPNPGRLRFHEIDAFRGMAALWVMIFHYWGRYQVIFHDAPGWPWLDQMDFGLLPVRWFFIISGFVITWSLEGCRTTGDFAVSRFSRLYPAYWTAMALVAVQALAVPLPGQAVTPGQVLAGLTMLQQIPGFADLDGVYWSLLVELLFYLLMGTLFRLGWMHRLHAVCLVWVGACIANSLLALAGHDVFWRVQKYALLQHAHFLVAGIMFFEIWQRRQVAKSWAILALCLASVALAHPAPAALVSAGFFGLFALAIGGRLQWLAAPPLLWLGGISYALYVTHQMLGYRLIMALEEAGLPQAAGAAIAAAAALVLATALHHTVELPAMAAIRTAWKRRRRQAMAAA